MTRDKQLRSVILYSPHNTAVIPARIAANMLHQHVNILAPEAQHLRKLMPYHVAVDITVNATQRSYLTQAVSYLYAAKVTGMPYLVTLLEILFVPVIPM